MNLDPRSRPPGGSCSPVAPPASVSRSSVCGESWFAGGQRLDSVRTVERTATRVTVPGVTLPTWQVDTAFPLVALAGIWRPSLLVARRVLEQIPDDELQVIVKHELAHARQRDNVAQLLLTAVPDVPGSVSSGDRHRASVARGGRRRRRRLGDRRRCTERACAWRRRWSVSPGWSERQVAPPVPLVAFHQRRLGRAPCPPPSRWGGDPITSHLLSCSSSSTVALAVRSPGLWLSADAVLLACTTRAEWLVNARP